MRFKKRGWISFPVLPTWLVCSFKTGTVWLMAVVPLCSPVQGHGRQADWWEGTWIASVSLFIQLKLSHRTFLSCLHYCHTSSCSYFPRLDWVVFLASVSAFKSILHSLARLTFCRHCFEQVTFLLSSLHWPSLARDVLHSLPFWRSYPALFILSVYQSWQVFSSSPQL